MKLKGVFTFFHKENCMNFLSGRPLRQAFLSIVLWSTQSLVMAIGTRHSDFSAILFPAFLVSSLFFLTFKLAHDKRSIRTHVIFPLVHKFKHFLIGSLAIFGSHLFFYWGLQIGPKVETSLTNFLWPLQFIIFGYALFNARFLNSRSGQHLIIKIKQFLGNGSLEFQPDLIEMDRLKVFKIMVGFVGVGFLLTHGNISNIDYAKWHGPFLGLLGGFLWAVFSIYLKFLGRVSYMALFIGGTTVLSGLWWGYSGFPNILPTLWISIYLGLFPLGLAMVTWERALKHGNTSKIGLIAFLAPLFSTALLYAFKIDYINFYSLIGASLVVLSNINYREIAGAAKNYLSQDEKIDFNNKLLAKQIFRKLVATIRCFFQTSRNFNKLKTIIYYLVVLACLPFKKVIFPILK